MVPNIQSLSFTHNPRSTSQIMLLVSGAMLPGIAVQWYWFGWGTLIQVFLGIVSTIVAEAIVTYLRRKSIRRNLGDCSALLTGLLLSISLPPLSPWWMVVSGCAFAIIIAKHLYGGLGHNTFNPAMVGYVVLLVSFPVQMTSWLPPYSIAAPPPGFIDSLQIIFHSLTSSGQTLSQFQMGIDGISQATPIDTLKTGLHTGHPISELLQVPIFNGILAGIGWQWINLAWLAGGLFLLWKRIIHWHIPISFLATLIIFSTVSWMVMPEKFASPLIHLFSGATMIGAFFILTDPVTAPATHRGRLIFGALIGLLVWVIRNWGGYPDGVAFAVLLGNITVPLIDYYTRPSAYGQH